MITATRAARPRTTHPEHNGAQHNGAQDNGVAAMDAAFGRIAEAEAALTRITETAAAGGAQTSTVADNIGTNLNREFTMIVRSVVDLARELFGGVAAEFGTIVGLNAHDDRQSDLCFGDPTAWV